MKEKDRDDNKSSPKGKELKKIERIKRLFGIDLCACGGSHKLRCHGSCREDHTNSGTGEVECSECYRIDHATKRDDKKGRKRTWKYGRQKRDDEDRPDKERRREKWERNKLD